MNAFNGKSHILQGIDLLVHPAELVVVAGCNGVGKIILLKSILG
jgi:ABC-type branched-subunit amino acid transport system ATPase component